jgi:hypothetical protein
MHSELTEQQRLKIWQQQLLNPGLRRNNPYKVNQSVWLARVPLTHAGAKFEPRWTGPYQIGAITGPANVQLIMGDNLINVHLDRVRPYRSPLEAQEDLINHPIRHSIDIYPPAPMAQAPAGDPPAPQPPAEDLDEAPAEAPAVAARTDGRPRRHHKSPDRFIANPFPTQTYRKRDKAVKEKIALLEEIIQNSIPYPQNASKPNLFDSPIIKINNTTNSGIFNSSDPNSFISLLNDDATDQVTSNATSYIEPDEGLFIGSLTDKYYHLPRHRSLSSSSSSTNSSMASMNSSCPERGNIQKLVDLALMGNQVERISAYVDGNPIAINVPLDSKYVRKLLAEHSELRITLIQTKPPQRNILAEESVRTSNIQTKLNHLFNSLTPTDLEKSDRRSSKHKRVSTCRSARSPARSNRSTYQVKASIESPNSGYKKPAKLQKLSRPEELSWRQGTTNGEPKSQLRVQPLQPSSRIVKPPAYRRPGHKGATAEEVDEITIEDVLDLQFEYNPRDPLGLEEDTLN